LFLGRFHPNKGADIAIDVAEQLGRQLVIAAPAPPDDQRDWFEQRVRPRLRGSIEWIGPVEGAGKAELIGRAAASLVPIRWDEPFGLVIVEAMACGTPPIVIRRGAAPELVVDGVTGFLVDDVEQMVATVDRVSTINPDACRRHVEANFTVEKMVDGYLHLFEDYLMRS
jgi:glycosyltransferase involved in cell wall biosynthesis